METMQPISKPISTGALVQQNDFKGPFMARVPDQYFVSALSHLRKLQLGRITAEVVHSDIPAIVLDTLVDDGLLNSYDEMKECIGKLRDTCRVAEQCCIKLKEITPRDMVLKVNVTTGQIDQYAHAARRMYGLAETDVYRDLVTHLVIDSFLDYQGAMIVVPGMASHSYVEHFSSMYASVLSGTATVFAAGEVATIDAVFAMFHGIHVWSSYFSTSEAGSADIRVLARAIACKNFAAFLHGILQIEDLFSLMLVAKMEDSSLLVTNGGLHTYVRAINYVDKVKPLDLFDMAGLADQVLNAFKHGAAPGLAAPVQGYPDSLLSNVMSARKYADYVAGEQAAATRYSTEINTTVRSSNASARILNNRRFLQRKTALATATIFDMRERSAMGAQILSLTEAWGSVILNNSATELGTYIEANRGRLFVPKLFPQLTQVGFMSEGFVLYPNAFDTHAYVHPTAQFHTAATVRRFGLANTFTFNLLDEVSRYNRPSLMWDTTLAQTMKDLYGFEATALVPDCLIGSPEAAIYSADTLSSPSFAADMMAQMIKVPSNMFKYEMEMTGVPSILPSVVSCCFALFRPSSATAIVEEDDGTVVYSSSVFSLMDGWMGSYGCQTSADFLSLFMNAANEIRLRRLNPNSQNNPIYYAILQRIPVANSATAVLTFRDMVAIRSFSMASAATQATQNRIMTDDMGIQFPTRRFEPVNKFGVAQGFIQYCMRPAGGRFDGVPIVYDGQNFISLDNVVASTALGESTFSVAPAEIGVAPLPWNNLADNFAAKLMGLPDAVTHGNAAATQVAAELIKYKATFDRVKQSFKDNQRAAIEADFSRNVITEATKKMLASNAKPNSQKQ